MLYLALASDGDGTLTRAGHLGKATACALERLRSAGLRIFLVTGEVEQEAAAFPRLDLFDAMISENGAVLHRTATAAGRSLAEPPPAKLLAALRRHHVEPLKVGRVAIATERPHDRIARTLLEDLGLDWQVTFNRRSVVLLPPGVNKATGLAALLKLLGLERGRVVGVGDAENDCPLLEFCGLGAAVGNALPELKRCARLIMRSGFGRGIVELIDHLLDPDGAVS